MMMAVDQTGQQDMAGEVEDDIRRAGQARGRADLLDDAVASEQSGITQFAPLAVHGHEHVGIPGEQCPHPGRRRR
jgi:hypothetical protein